MRCEWCEASGAMRVNGRCDASAVQRAGCRRAREALPYHSPRKRQSAGTAALQRRVRRCASATGRRAPCTRSKTEEANLAKTCRRRNGTRTAGACTRRELPQQQRHDSGGRRAACLRRSVCRTNRRRTRCWAHAPRRQGPRRRRGWARWPAYILNTASGHVTSAADITTRLSPGRHTRIPYHQSHLHRPSLQTPIPVDPRRPPVRRRRFQASGLPLAAFVRWSNTATGAMVPLCVDV